MATFGEALTRKARYKTRLRTIRLPVAIDSALEEEAEKRGMTMNSFVVSLLERYSEWDMLAEKFRFITFPMEMVREEYSLIKDQVSLKRMARDLGAKMPRELILFWFKEVNLDTFLRYLSLQARFQSYAQYEIVHHNDRLVIIAKHQLGPNWSVWLAAYLEEAIRSNLDVVPRVELTDNTVKIEFEKR